MAAATKAIGALTICIDRGIKAIQAAHTLNPVPFLYIGRNATLTEHGALHYLAHSLLAMMDFPKSAKITGQSLIQVQ